MWTALIHTCSEPCLAFLNLDLKSTRSPEIGLSLTNDLLIMKEKGLENISRYYNTILKTMLSPAALQM